MEFLDCQHIEQRLVRQYFQSGVDYAVVYQCAQCGEKIGNPIKKSAVVGGAISLPLFDDDLRNGNRAAIQQGHQMARQQQVAEYRRYLETPEWKQKRIAVLERDKFECQAKMAGCVEAASQVHHLSYKFLFDEPLFDLASVCVVCHERISAMQKGIRPMNPGLEIPPF